MLSGSAKLYSDTELAKVTIVGFGGCVTFNFSFSAFLLYVLYKGVSFFASIAKHSTLTHNLLYARPFLEEKKNKGCKHHQTEKSSSNLCLRASSGLVEPFLCGD